jgi:hypothetical protein
MKTKSLFAGLIFGFFSLLPSGKAEAQCNFTPSYTEDFSTYTPTCWTETSGRLGASSTFTTTTSDWGADGFLNNGSTGAARMNIYSTTKDEWLVSPIIDLGTGAYQVEFNTGLTDYTGSGTDLMGPDDSLAIVISLDAGVTWSTSNILKLYVAGDQPSNTGETVIIDLSAYTGSVKIGFYAASTISNTDYNVYIDDFAVNPLASCAAPGSLMSSNINVTDADIAWTENGTATSWQIEYGAAGFTQGSGTYSIEASTSATLSSLTSNTEYEYYVRAICGVGDTSSWTTSAFFTTLCSPFTAPYYNGFENDILDVAPGCWDSYLSFSNGWVEVEDFTGTAAPFLGSQALYLYNSSGSASDTLIAITPQFTDLPAGDKRIRFQANADNVTTRLVVGTIASPIPTATFNPIQIITFAADDTYQEAIVEMTTANGYNGTDQYIVLAHEMDGGTYKYIRIDEFNYEVIPSCIAPSSLTANAITATTADLSWTENGTATSWEVEYGPTGFTLGTGTSSIESMTSMNLSSLADNTDFDVYVRAICAVGDSSYWTYTISFTTLCLPFTAPYYNGFENDVLDIAPGCWNSYSSYTSGWVEVEDFTGASAPFAGTQGLYLYNSGASTTDTLIAISPQFSDLTAGDKRLRFQANADNVTTRLVVGTIASPIATATFNPIQTVTFAADDTYQQVIVEMTTANGYNGTDEFIVLAHELNGGTYKYIRIDEFNYEVIPSCLAPSSLSTSLIGFTNTDISWTENGTATSWEYEYDLTGFTPGTGNSVISATQNGSITGLTSNTTYDFYVRAICGVGDTSAWSLVSSFTTNYISCTPSLAVILPFTEDWESANGTVNGPADIICNPDHTWHLLSSDPQGRARFGTAAEQVSGGLGAITLDRDPNGNVTANDLILALDMSSYTTDTDLELSFEYTHHGEELHDNDSVWIRASSTSPWVGVYDLYANKGTVNVFNNVGPIDIDAALAAAGQTVSTSFQVRFGQEDNFPAPSDGFTFDNVSIISNPCNDPTALTATNFTGTSADLGWTENGTATSWNIEYGPVGFTTGSGTVVIATTNPSTVTGLNPCSDYEYYVQSDCGGSLSAMVGPFAFSTSTVVLTQTDVVNACETFTWTDGMTYTASNNTATYTVVGAGVSGCDSTYTLDLTINNSTTGTDVQTACDSYTWIDGNDYTANNNTSTFTIVGGAANGCDSIVTLDLTINNATTGTDTQVVCDSYTWIDGMVYTADNNTATFTIVGGAANGCDSTVTLDLTISTVDVTTTQTGGINLSANAAGATYQWIDCDNGDTPVVGETNQSFTVLVNGNYAVIVTENGCSDTSACILVDNVDLTDNDKILGISLYPNPTNGAVTVLFENMEANQYDLEVIDATGRKLAQQTITDNSTLVDLSAYDKGVYIIRISNGTSESIHRVIKR